MYKNGDYVILKDSKYWYRNYAVISNILSVHTYVKLFFPNKKFYSLNGYDGNYYIWIKNNEIERKMTKDEKKELKVLLEAEKFNI